VIKANAYGHGQWRAVETLRGEADGFAVLECDNAVALREAGVSQPILLLEGIFSARDARAVAETWPDCVVHCLEQTRIAARRSGRRGSPLSIHLKLNTGMNRLGFCGEHLAGGEMAVPSRPSR
jgi:alanine racemase